MIGKYSIDKCFDYENGFYLTSEPYRMGNIMAHYELYKKILDLPGDVIELGVFKGSSLIQFATFRELLENEKSRKIVGFDVFGEFPQGNEVLSDKEFVEKWNDSHREDFLSEDDIYKSLTNKQIGNVKLVKGDICQTIDEYLVRNPHTRIALLHIDTDIFEPALHGLEKLYDRVVKGGVIVFDDYATIEGETLAIEKFFRDKNKDLCLKKFSFSHVKPSYMIKE